MKESKERYIMSKLGMQVLVFLVAASDTEMEVVNKYMHWIRASKLNARKNNVQELLYEWVETGVLGVMSFNVKRLSTPGDISLVHDFVKSNDRWWEQDGFANTIYKFSVGMCDSMTDVIPKRCIREMAVAFGVEKDYDLHSRPPDDPTGSIHSITEDGETVKKITDELILGNMLARMVVVLGSGMSVEEAVTELDKPYDWPWNLVGTDARELLARWAMDGTLDMMAASIVKMYPKEELKEFRTGIAGGSESGIYNRILIDPGRRESMVAAGRLILGKERCERLANACSIDSDA